jgi:hypothetical protein
MAQGCDRVVDALGSLLPRGLGFTAQIAFDVADHLVLGQLIRAEHQVFLSSPVHLGP